MAYGNGALIMEGLVMNIGDLPGGAMGCLTTLPVLYILPGRQIVLPVYPHRGLISRLFPAGVMMCSWLSSTLPAYYNGLLIMAAHCMNGLHPHPYLPPEWFFSRAPVIVIPV